MFPKTHIIIGTLFCLMVILLFPQVNWLGVSLILFSSILIDFDHYLYYVYIKKDINLKKAYNWFLDNAEKNKSTRIIILFHGIEFLLILFLLNLFNNIFFFVLVGVSLHLLCDFLSLYKNKKPFYLKISQIYVYFKKRKVENGY